MDKFNIRVLIKEPRGFIRILQVLISGLAWLTTTGFKTKSTLHIDCPDLDPYTVEYKIEYPFDLRDTEVSAPSNCTDDTSIVEEKFPIDFSATSMLFVLICFLSLVYALGALVFYSFFTAKYETDPLAPVIDLSVTILLAVCWIVITCTWALNVSDLKHYTHPNNFKDHLEICKDTEANCQPSNPGRWSPLTVTIVYGFASSILWLGSTWFIFKETTLHKKQTYQSGGQTTIVQQSNGV